MSQIETHGFTEVRSEVVVHTAHMRGRDAIEVIGRNALLLGRERADHRLRLFQDRAEALEAAALP